MGTVVVTGVAGSLGQRVVARLAERPDVDRVLGIDVVPTNAHPAKVEARVLDLAWPLRVDDDELIPMFEGVDGVIHLAWRTTDGPANDPTGATQANQQALRRVLAAAAVTRPASLVHLSSATVYGAWPDNPVPLTEDSVLRPNPEFPFALDKAEAERVVAEWALAYPDVAVAVLRPAVTVGSPERPLYRALGGTRAPRAGDGSRPVQFLHVDDLAAAVVLAWERQLSGVYNVAPDRGIREDTARALAGGVARLSLPGWAAKGLAAWSWDLWRWGVPREAQAFATNPWVIAPDRLEAQGWQPKYSSEEALVATDLRPHWDDLPPGRRQNYTLLAAIGVPVVVAALVAGIVAWRAAVGRRVRSRRWPAG